MSRDQRLVGVGVLAAIGLTVGFLAGSRVSDRPGASTVIRADSDLIPPRTTLADVAVLRGTVPQQVAVAWVRHGAEYGSGYGITVWERRGGSWQRIYTRNLPARTEFQIEDIKLWARDVTSDGRDDLLAYDDHDGSAGGFTFRALRSTPGHIAEIDSLDGTADRNAVFTFGTELVKFTGVGKDPASDSSIHCCPKYWLRTVQRWDGKSLVVVSRSRRRTVPTGGLDPVR